MCGAVPARNQDLLEILVASVPKNLIEGFFLMSRVSVKTHRPDYKLGRHDLIGIGDSLIVTPSLVSVVCNLNYVTLEIVSVELGADRHCGTCDVTHNHYRA